MRFQLFWVMNLEGFPKIPNYRVFCFNTVVVYKHNFMYRSVIDTSRCEFKVFIESLETGLSRLEMIAVTLRNIFLLIIAPGAYLIFNL